MTTKPYSCVEMTPELQLRFERLHEAEVGVYRALTDIEAQPAIPERVEWLRTACAALGTEITACCPPSADRSAAERCARLAWMVGHEAVQLQGYDDESALRCLRLAADEALRARLQAGAAVALAAPGTLPPLVD